MINRQRRPSVRTLLAAAALVLATSALHAPALAQVAAAPDAGWDPTAGAATRENLQAVLARYEAAARSTAYSDVLRGEAEEQARALRERLEQGDFRPGDDVFVRVEQHAELTDTLQVAADRRISMPLIGDVDLNGVLRAELDTVVERRIAEMVRDPRVHTRSFVRVAVTGGVANPGFYTLDSQTVLSDAVMRTGGPTRDAQLSRLRIMRGDSVVVSSDALAEAVTRGATIDQVGLRNGDRLDLPERQNRSILQSARDLLYVVPAALAVFRIL